MKFFKTFLSIALLTSLAAGGGFCDKKGGKLHSAAYNGNEMECGAALEKGANVNARDKDGETLLMRAIKCGNYEYAKMILKEKVDVNLANNFGRTVLHYAAKKENENVCSDLLEKGANVNAQDVDKETPLMIAINHGNYECAKIILKEKVDVNLANNFGRTALHLAAIQGNENLCGAVLEKGANVNAQTTVGEFTPLMRAIPYRNNKCAKMILREYPNLEITNKINETALRIAAKSRNAEMIEILEIAANEGIKESVRFFLKEKQSIMNIRGYVAGKGRRKPKVIENIKMEERNQDQFLVENIKM